MKINVGWKYKLWTDKDVDEFSLKNIKLYNNIKNLGAKSDIFRYEILERLGGVYIDVDFDCVKPFDDLLTLDFFAGNGHVDVPEIFNSVMASSPNYKYMTALVNELLKKDYFKDNIDGVMNNTGPYFITRVFYDNINEDDNVVIFPTKYFFPFPAVHRFVNYDQSKDFIHSFNNDKTYCIHLWHTNWQK
jgi:mannosyltransferase OCH1-like enzyme